VLISIRRIISQVSLFSFSAEPRKPAFVEPFKDVKVIDGQPLLLTAKVIGFPSPEVHWYKDGIPLRPSPKYNFVNDPNGVIGLSIDAVKPEDAGVYSVTIGNKLGEITGTSIVTVEPKDTKPRFVSELQDIVAVDGFPVKFDAKVVGHPTPNIAWSHDGEPISPGGDHFRVTTSPDGSSSLVIDKVTPEDSGKYEVAAINPKGTVSSAGKLSVCPLVDESQPEEPPSFLNSLRDTAADEGKELALSAQFIGKIALEKLKRIMFITIFRFSQPHSRNLLDQGRQPNHTRRSHHDNM
jgi:hypothetical protein